MRGDQISRSVRHSEDVGFQKPLKPCQPLIWCELRESNGFNASRALFEEVPLCFGCESQEALARERSASRSTIFTKPLNAWQICFAGDWKEVGIHCGHSIQDFQ